MSEGTHVNTPKDEAVIGQSGGIFGPGGLSILGGSRPQDAEMNNGLGVNSFLWRASLDTISFMPLASADPFGGIIVSDYYSPPDTPDQRLKVQIFISDRKLTASGVRASVFRQERGTDGRWTDAPVDPQTATKLENAILARARELRVTTAQAQ